MFIKLFIASVLISISFSSAAEVSIDESKFGDLLGGWKRKKKNAAEYSISGSEYRTYRPEITPTPDGGIFVSLRIDHMRGWLSTDDYAVLEITVNPTGKIVSARSSMAIQGRSISSDLIRGGAEVGKAVIGRDRAVQIGSDLVADISQKLLREKIVEAGRVSFPSALRHNYNLLYQSIELRTPEKVVKEEKVSKGENLSTVEVTELEKLKAPQAKTLEIQPYSTSDSPSLPVEKSE